MNDSVNRRQFISALSLATVPLSGSLKEASGSANSHSVKPRTWLELNGKLYGAQPDSAGPIGGGAGYANLVTKGDYTVEDVPGLLDALSRVKEGQVVFIPAEITLDLTTMIYIENFVLQIPGGITLAGERGNNGSVGAILTSDALKTPLMARVNGPGTRITGLRFQGPNPKRYIEHHRKAFGPGGEGHSYYYKFPTSRGIVTEFADLTVDNCEISAFSRCGINLAKGTGHRIHHNHIHHCQYNGLGYGVSLDTASAIIEHNMLDYNRHSIAGTGRPGCGYVARHNVELGTSLSHCFDMHGGRDRKDGTNIAGTSIEIINNAFYQPERAVGIRGEPEQSCTITRNWFVRHSKADGAVYGLSAKTTATDNVYGEHPETSY